MSKQGFKVLDSDMHIMEPVDLWEKYIDKAFRHEAPRGLERHVGDLLMVHPNGKPWGMDPKTHEYLLQSAPANPNRSRARDEDRFADHAARGWTAEVQLEAMEAEGIDLATLYPTRGLHALDEPGLDPRLCAAVARAYNDWLYDFCQRDPSHLIGVAMISVWDVNDAIAETRRAVKELGFRGVFLRPNIVNGLNWYDPYYEDLWSTLEDLDVPLGFHEALFSSLPEVGSIFGTNFMLRHTFAHSGEQMLATASFCGGGILQRHPRLKVAFLEGNCSWLPWLLYRLDEHWEQTGDRDAPELTMAPSEYFKRQCFASVEPDEDPVKYAIDFAGNDRLVFSTDYPHSDSKYPAAVDRFLRIDISDEDKRKILWDNCAHIYGVAE